MSGRGWRLCVRLFGRGDRLQTVAALRVAALFLYRSTLTHSDLCFLPLHRYKEIYINEINNVRCSGGVFRSRYKKLRHGFDFGFFQCTP